MAEKRKLAFYIRLSDADEEVKAGTKDESNSITGQRKLLYAYIKKTEEFAGFEVLEYFDDGYSGTMFNNRAEFQRLIQDAELGRFECIIVKDFSRFGRDYLEVGNYLEFVFPAMGMRFISVNDNYDSDRNFGVTGGMDVAYKNLIYQLYSMDLSRKVKSARRTRNLSGEYTASFVCYGYKKDPDDKHKLIIDEEAAKVVVEIFSLIIAGYNASEVARILNERKIPTRVQNQWKNGINYVPVHNKGDYMWDNSEVIAIVQNEQYKGIMIQNKCETVGFGDNKKVRKRNKEDWSVVEGAIPRIVSDEMFYEVNKMLRVEARGIEKSTKKRKKNLFICPYCGRKLMNSSAVCTPKLLCPKRRMVRTGECQQIFMLKSEAQDKVLEITKEICRTLIQEEELKKASKDKRKVTGVVQRYIGKNVSINLGKADALLTESEQIKGEVFKPTERIKVYILEVKSTSKGPKILVSRTHPELVKRLFESEVTEVKEGIVEIKAISREAGSRTKIAVWSNDPNVDPVGACVGMNGARVNAIVNELRGEKIDIITWDENPAILIQNALSPAKVISVIADADEKSAKVVVPDYQLSLAIGKEGQNARLAARLTGFKIDIKSETQARESGDFMDYENDYEEDDYDDDYDYSDDELAENERLADTEQADVQAEAFDTEADENGAAGTENDAADSGDEQ